jgi:hypothetical protein
MHPIDPRPEPSVDSSDNSLPPAAATDCSASCGGENGTIPLSASETDRRAQSDRREKPTSPWAAFPPAGYRMRNRRVEEHRQPYFTDRFSPLIFLGILMLIAATFVDAGLTVYVLRGGGSEVNPLMDRLLSHSIEAFVIGKYLLTVVGLPVLLIFRNHYLFGTQLRVGHLIPVSVALYAVLIGYQVILIDQRIGW